MFMPERMPDNFRLRPNPVTQRVTCCATPQDIVFKAPAPMPPANALTAGA